MAASTSKEVVAREALYEEVWAEPMTKVALKYNVSGSFLARICSRLKVPRPSRGYWAMLAAGKKPKRVPLPSAQPGDELEWARNGRPRIAQLQSPRIPQEQIKKRLRWNALPEVHPLLEGMKESFLEGKELDSGLLKPRKYALVDVLASRPTLDRALSVLNDLFLSLEKKGFPVKLEPHGQYLARHAVEEREKGGRQRQYSDLWGPSRCTLVFIGTVAYGITLFEMTEEVEVRYQDGKYVRVSDVARKKQRLNAYSWTSTREMASGRLCLQVYSPYRRVPWVRQWREAKSGDFPRKLSGVGKELEAEVAQIVRLYEEGERQAEIERQKREAEHQEYLRKCAEEDRQKAEQKSKDDLLQVIERWGAAKRIETFFDEVEERASGLSKEEKLKILERLELARKFLGSTDVMKRFESWKTPEEWLKTKTYY